MKVHSLDKMSLYLQNSIINYILFHFEIHMDPYKKDPVQKRNVTDPNFWARVYTVSLAVQ